MFLSLFNWLLTNYISFFILSCLFLFILSFSIFIIQSFSNFSKNSVLSLIQSNSITISIFMFYLFLFLTVLLHIYTLFIFTQYMTIATNESLTAYDYLSFEGLNLTLSLDPLSLLFIILLTFLIPVCMIIYGTTTCLFLWEKESVLLIYGSGIYNSTYSPVNNTFFGVLLLLISLEWVLFNLFTVINYFSFYIFFELSLIPTYLLIALLGVRINKIKAAYYLLFYTLLGSFFLLSHYFILYTFLELQILRAFQFLFNQVMFYIFMLFIFFCFLL